MFGTGQNQDHDQDQDQNWDSQESPALLDETSWSGFKSTELDDGFTYGR